MAGAERPHLGLVFDEVPDLYDRVRPRYPDDLFADLVAITGMDERSSVLEVGCGTGQATRSLADARVLGDRHRAGNGNGDTRSPAACGVSERRRRDVDV